MNVMLASSAATVVSFPPAADRPTFAVATKAWLKTTTADRRLTAGEARLCAALYQHFNYEHYEKTRELIAWPSWQTLMAWSTLSKTAVHNSIKKLKRLRLLEVEHGRYNRATRRRSGNLYHVPPRFSVVNLIPDQGSRARFTTKVHHGVQDSVNRLGDNRLGDKKAGLSRKEKPSKYPEEELRASLERLAAPKGGGS
jgi:Replication protein C N-terminal domain